MSSFGSRRKARVIKVDDEVGEGAENAGSETGSAATTDPSLPSFKIKSVKKGSRQSGLRKAFAAESADIDVSSTGNEGDDDVPVVIKPKFGPGKQRKKLQPRLSFGLEKNEDDDVTATLETSMKQSTLGQRAVENSALKRGIAMRGFPPRTFENEDERPRYSKEYLDELQSSTPTTPMDTASIPTDPDEMELDPSELEGAMVVDSPAVAVPAPRIQVLTDAEIQERKERRARLAQEQDFLSVEDDDRDLGATKKKDDNRLVQDEDQMGEGFDEFVEDGGVQ
ncbi:hypothetical protein NQ176_g9773 [Zarea fungicola]|uniref:Uncharacterized protein n=1 Tax=Zarea fungicola TaxID=93591 RepID=A0ACC1MK36_9HYPO|nr:hypothetical protein NQ176_g9773 [Lecanicillium fungicola]